MSEFVSGIVDVFADGPLRGNPLSIVEGGELLDDDLLRRIAREFNQAETTFIMQSTRADRKLRSFTASGSEVFGAGHNALGAWLWLAYSNQLGPLDAAATFRQEIGDAVLPIVLQMHDGRVQGKMLQSPLTLLPCTTTLASLGPALGIDASEILKQPPPRTANTGAPHLMVRLRSKETVDRVEPAQAILLAVLAAADAEGCYCYAFDEANPSTAYARFFNPTVGLWEDSATGTAAGPLCAYLGSESMLPTGELVVEQGTRMGRQSFLSVELTPDAALSGSGVVVLRGRLEI
jgi:PhzF family phenazine biosynthesis protein